MTIGTAERPLWVAVVGSGPSGFYAAEALLKKQGLNARVDMFDRLPTPFGLVRGGVAPDHQKIKSVIKAYEKVAALPTYRFFGNVMLGRDLQVTDLRAHYDQIIYAVGNESDRKLGIPGEDLKGSHSATAFVGWYNGHPDHCDHDFDLSCERAAIVGMGNVSMDVARMLAHDTAHLAGTDIAQYALDALAKSRVREIYLLGRRGPAEAAYSPTEITELGSMESADLVVTADEARVDEASLFELSDSTVKKNVEYVAAHVHLGEGTHPKKVRLRFRVSPVELLGEGGRLTGLKLEKNRLEPDGKGSVRAVGTGTFEVLPVGLVFRAVGYRGVPIEGVPFDTRSGKIPNAAGRVLDGKGEPVPCQYVVGWAKRGPTGLIGTNRGDSAATVTAMLEDLQAGKLGSAERRGEIEAVLRARHVDYVTFDKWKQLDQHEVERGAAAKKLREKVTRIDEMLRVLKR